MTGGSLRVVEAGLIAALLGSSALAAIAASPPPPMVSLSTLVVAQANPAAKTPAVAAPYTWSASKFAGGGVSFGGFVPSQDERQSLLDGIDNLIADNTQLASGEPDGFAEDAAAALDVLDALDTGKVSFDGSTWSINGTVGSADKLTIAKAAYDSSPLAALGAGYEVKGPAAAAAATVAAAIVAAPDISAAPALAAAGGTPSAVAPSPNYAWSVEKAGDGTVTFNGTVPNDKLKRFLLSEAGAASLDNSTVAAGAPKDFVGGALNGLDALLKLQSGKLLFANGSWSLAGIAASKADVASVHTALAIIDTKAWTFDIKVPVEPVAVATPTTPAPTAHAAVPLAPLATPKAPPPAVLTPPASPPVAKTAPVVAAPATTPIASAPVAPVAVTATPTTPKPAPAIAPPPTTTTGPAPYVFGAAKAEDGATVLTGDVPTAAIKDYFGVGGSDIATDQLDIVADAPPGFVGEALHGLEALDKLGSGQLAFDGKTWSLKGSAVTPDAQAAVAQAIASLPDGAQWVTAIAGPPPLDLCRASLAGFDQLNAITFDAGTRFSKQSAAALDTLASQLAVCPEARVDVEGNTDTDGNANANMALSVARAEAVVGELVRRGVDANRLYAIGNGENVPVVPNTSAQNKARNRRIDIEVEPGGGK